MRSILTLAAVAVAAVTFTAAAPAADEIPFPANVVADVFVAAQTVGADGATTNFFKPGSPVIFRAYAVDGKSSKVLGAKDVKYFYVTIPGQPNVKLKYDAKATGASARLAWTGTWNVPAAQPSGIVGFKVLVQTTSKKRGQYVQLPVSSSQLTISTNPPNQLGGGTPAGSETAAAKLPVSLSVDTVNGTRPTGAAPREIGCAQTTVYKRGEQLVFRVWGADTSSNEVLSTANVDTATVTIPGVAAPLALNWGAHGATDNRVWFWSAPWIIPADYPFGTATLHIAFKTDSGKAGTYDHVVNIIP
jgi:hypothetical protein